MTSNCLYINAGLEYFLRDIPDIIFIEEIGEGEDITKIAKIAQVNGFSFR